MENKFDIFVSWHNDINDPRGKDEQPYSKAVATEYKRFIEFIFEQKDCVFCSAVDIIGDWRKNLSVQLRDCDYAIFVITDKAIESGWLHAEYGAFMMKSILKSDNPDYTNLFPVCELRGNNEVSIGGPIKDLQVFYPVCVKDSIKEETYKTKFYELLSRIPINKPNFEALFKLNFDIFRKRIEQYKKDGIACEKYIRRIDEYQYKTIETQSVAVPTANIQTDVLRPLDNFRTRTDIIERDDVIKTIKGHLDNHSVVNVIGMGGCGKTTITYSFYNEYNQEFSLIAGVVINNNFYEDFDEEFTDELRIGYDLKDGKKDYVKTFNRIVDIMNQYDCKRENGHICYNLLILDVNEKSKYYEVEEALKVLKEKLQKRWKFLVVSRETVNPNETATVDLYTLQQVKEPILEKIFFRYLTEEKRKRYQFNEEQFLTLFDKLGYLPLLVEQLAYFLVSVSEPYDFDKIMRKLGDKVLHSDFANKKLKKGERYEKEYEIIGEFLSKLMDFHERLSTEQRNIARYFMMWPAQYYRVGMIEKLTGLDDLDRELNRLAEKCVLDQKDDNGYSTFKMHGLIAESFRDQVFTKDENKEYRDFTTYLSNTNFSGLEKEEKETVRNCIVFSLANFASFDEKYLLQEAQRYGERSIYETALKIKVLKLTNKELSNEDIYKEIVGVKDGERKEGNKINELADQLYFSWLQQQPDKRLVPKRTDRDGNVFISIEGVEIKMIKVDGGAFKMGAQKTNKNGDNYDDEAYDRESPVHNVELSDFYIGETPVTQGLWKAVMGRDNNPSSFDKGNDYPVESVSWYDCLNFIIELNKKTGLKFRFPTEAQWEFAARGGNKHSPYKYSGGKNIEDVAVYWGNSKNDSDDHCSSPVKSKAPNKLGIYDMSGNVYEWCQDWYDDYTSGNVDNPTGPSSGSSRVLRGGSWAYDADYCRVSHRNYDSPGGRFNIFGMRLALPCSPFPS